MAPNPHVNLHRSQLDNALNLLNKGEDIVKINDDIVLILGVTGAGKSTLLQFISGDNDKLYSIGDDINDYRVIDEEERISNATIVSKTIFPECLVDRETNTFVYDCPGFSDTRNLTINLTASYFLKKLTDNAKRIKLIFVVNYFNVKKGVDRHGFMDFLKHTTKLIKNIRNYSEGMTLVVTKVDNSLIKTKDKKHYSLSDEQIKNLIANYLLEVKYSLTDKLNSETNLDFLQNAINIIDVFLTRKKNSTNYDKICLFRRPDRSGPLSQIKLLQDEKIILRNTIFKETVFVPCNKSDFCYSISDKTQTDIIYLVKQIHAQIHLCIEKIKLNIETYYLEKITAISNIIDLEKYIKTEAGMFKSFVLELIQIKHPALFIKHLVEGLNILGISSVEEMILKQLFNQILHLQYLQSFLNQPLIIEVIKWIEPINDGARMLNDWIRWIEFLYQINMTFSKYAIQKNTKLYNVKDLAHWNIVNKPQGLIITQSNFFEFLNKVHKVTEVSFENVDKISLDSIKLSFLNEILEYTLKNNLRSTCSTQGKLTIKGNFVKISEVDKMSCPKEIHEIEVFAFDTIFFDADLIRKGFHLSVLSPKWSIHGVRKIILDGDEGKPHVNLRAKSGTKYKPNGEHGKSGHPGRPGGSFFGIGFEFEQSNLLTISCKGGTGGTGQDGGDGMNGEDGVNEVKVPSGRAYKSCPREKFEVDNGYFEIEDQSISLGIVDNSYQADYKGYGDSGVNGGDGGNGGVGGYGGKSGHIVMLDLSNSSNINLVKGDGDRGIGGDAGSAGVGGKNSDIVVAHCSEHLAVFVAQWSSWMELNKLNGGRAYAGQTGEANVSKTHLKLPENMKPFKGSVQCIEDFKYELRYKLHDMFHKQKLFDFMKNIDESALNEYTISHFVLAFKKLEQQFLQIRNTDEVTNFYQSLLNRIVKYAYQKSLTSEDKYVLTFLYTAIFSKISRLKMKGETSLIIDLTQYLDHIIESFKKELTFEEIVNVNKYTSEYKNMLDDKIDEAEKHVKEYISTEINLVSTNIDAEINVLLGKTLELQKQAEEYKHELQIKKQELKHNLIKSAIFRILKTVNKVVGLFGPIGSIISGITGTVTDITESITQSEPMEITIPKGLSNALTQVNQVYTFMFDKKRKIFENELNKLSQKLNQVSNIDNLNQLVNETRHSLAEENQNVRTNCEKIKEIQDKLKISLKQKETELQKKEKSYKTVIKSIKHFNKAIEIADLSVNVYNQCKDDANQMEAIENQIIQAGNDIAKIRNYRQEIENILTPMIQDMATDLLSMETKLKNQSKIKLDIARWKVQSRLKEVKLYLRAFISLIDAQIHENFVLYVEKLEDTMNTLINIYDRIENYNEEKNLVHYLGKISTKTQILNNTVLQSDLDHLNLYIQQNIISLQYEHFTSQFVQWIFPFAKTYLQEHIIPSNLALSSKTNMQLVLSAYRQNIDNLRNKLIDYKFTINKNDQFLHHETFSSEYKSNQPFYIWRNSKYGDIIEKLLSGEEVVLYSNIEDSNPDYNGVKFNFIKLNFKTKTDQPELDKILDYFRISLTHMGNSYYKCRNEIYLITTPSQTIIYSQQNEKFTNQPVHYNDVYKKLKTGDLLLSPYTMWKIKLNLPKFINSTMVLNSLNKFKNNTDLELWGQGYYTTNMDICIDLNHYYGNNHINDEFTIPVKVLKFKYLNHINEHENIDDIISNYKDINTNRRKRSIPRKILNTDPNLNEMKSKSTIERILEWPCNTWDKIINSVSDYFQKDTCIHSQIEFISRKNISYNSLPNYNINSTILLLDLLIRRYINNTYKSNLAWDVPEQEIHAFAIHLTYQIEATLSELLYNINDTKNAELDFDPVEVQKRIIYLIKSQQFIELGSLALITIKNAIPTIDEDRLKTVLRNKKLLWEL